MSVCHARNPSKIHPVHIETTSATGKFPCSFHKSALFAVSKVLPTVNWPRWAEIKTSIPRSYQLKRGNLSFFVSYRNNLN